MNLQSVIIRFTIACILLFAARAKAQDGSSLLIKEGIVHVNGTDLYYEVMGEGTPMVIVHGGPGMDHTYLLPQMAKLARHYKLIFYDQRASGKSSSVVDTNSMTMDNFVEDLDGIRRALDLGKMNLLAHSWGGLIAMFYAIKHPGNLNSLMLIDASPGSSALRNESFAIMSQRTSHEDSVAETELIHTEGFQKHTPEAMEKFFRILFRGTFYNKRYADSLTITLDSNYAAQSHSLAYLYRDTSLASYDLFAKLSVVHCPTLIVTGDHDMVPADANERLHGSIAGSKYIVIKNCGHFPFIEAPNEFFNVLEDFLTKVAR